MSLELKSLIIFTDGACTGNPGPGGWASILAFPEGRVRELGGGADETTNNRMELMGALRALRFLKEPPTPDIFLFTDSTYVIRGITQWIWGWRRKGWKNAEGGEVANRDLWEDLAREIGRLKPAQIHWRYSRGHSGIPGNERCDEIAVAFANGRHVKLFDGSLLNYSVAIHDLPPEEDLPPMKTYEKKPAAHSYLSLHGGIVMRHSTWAECERRVKGQSQAKFKKAMSEKEESTILQSWGLDPKTTTILE
ncbi:MAG: ribonuclease HI [Bdellovibrionales bacterium]